MVHSRDAAAQVVVFHAAATRAQRPSPLSSSLHAYVGALCHLYFAASASPGIPLSLGQRGGYRTTPTAPRPRYSPPPPDERGPASRLLLETTIAPPVACGRLRRASLPISHRYSPHFPVTFTEYVGITALYAAPVAIILTPADDASYECALQDFAA